MRRRKFLAGVGLASLSTLAGCTKCGETWTDVGFEIIPTSLERTSDSWRVGADIEVQFDFGRERTGVFGAALAGFDEEARVVGTTWVGDLTWPMVSEANRTENECGAHGRLQQHVTVETDAFPQWVGIRYDEVEPHDTGIEPRKIARHGGDPDGRGAATVEGYEPVSVDSLTPSPRSVATSPPIEGLTFRSEGVTCHPTPEPEMRYPFGDVVVDYARSVPEPRFHATLADYAYGEVIRFDIGLEPRLQLRRTDCTAAAYEVSTRYDDELEPEPKTVKLRHLDRHGEVLDTFRKPLDSTTTSRRGSSTETPHESRPHTQSR